MNKYYKSLRPRTRCGEVEGSLLKNSKEIPPLPRLSGVGRNDNENEKRLHEARKNVCGESGHIGEVAENPPCLIEFGCPKRERRNREIHRIGDDKPKDDEDRSENQRTGRERHRQEMHGIGKDADGNRNRH